MTRATSALLVLLMGCSLLPLRALADDITADSAIKAVTVYNDRAKVTRQAVITLPAGANVIVFHGLPAILLPDSLRAEGTAKANVKFGAVAYKQIITAELSAPREKELNDQMETLSDQRNLLTAAKEALAQKKGFLEDLGKQAKLRSNENIAQVDLKPDQWLPAAQAIYTGINESLAADIQQDIKLRELDRQIEKVQRELNQLQTGQSSTYDVTVPLESESATKLTIDLSYQVPNATWRPLYDARLDTESEKLELVEYGTVSQTTGEDWKNAALTLSTAQPQRGAGLPDLQPQWIDVSNGNFLQQSARFGYAGGKVSNMAMSAMPAAGGAQAYQKKALAREEMDQDKAAAAPQEAQFVAAQVETGGFVSEYKIPGPSTVAADGTETKLMVGTFDTDSKIQIHIKPQLSIEAFLVAKTKLKGDSPTLPGQVNLFRDGAYVGQDMLPLLRPGEEHGLYFGVDDQVSVKRKLLKDEKSEAGIIARNNVLERDFVTELQNSHTRPIEVVVKETIPVGRNDKIGVEIVKDATTPGYEQDAANIKGMLQWQFSMTPNEKKDLDLGWKVSWPKDLTLTGF